MLKIFLQSKEIKIRIALNRWGDANASANCSRVGFYEGPGDGISSTLLFENGRLTGSAAARIFRDNVSSNILLDARIRFDIDLTLSGDLFYNSNQPGYDTIFIKETLHEVGHGMGLTHYYSSHPDGCRLDPTTTADDQIAESSVMNNACGINDYTNNQSNIATNVTNCDNPRINGIYPCSTPTPTPDPCGEEPPEGWDMFCRTNYGQFFSWNANQCRCENDDPWESPIVIDVLGNGFNLTNYTNGVDFDIRGDGNAVRLAWTSAGSDDSWLALDRNGNSTIDDGKELFGNSTAQPAPPLGEERNGFLALAEFDKPTNGGNNDSNINQQDAVFQNLRLWQDANHNGISEVSEMKTLAEVGLRKIELDYSESRRTDEHGNKFKYRAKVKDAQDAQLGRWAWDVYLAVQSPQN